MDSSDLQKAFDFLCQVKQDLKIKNRFSADKRLDTLIDLYAEEKFNEQDLTKGTMLYRARVYKRGDAQTRFNNPPTGTRFKGYDAGDSFVNLNYEYVGEGRCNPQYIPYLYASASANCCIHEIRPAKEAYVSIAKIKVEEPLRILRLNAWDVFISNSGSMIVDGVPNVTMFMYLANEFSRPHKEFGDYLLCQYISEKVKSYGFDGIAYASAVYGGKDNVNYVIFNYKKCKPISSALRLVSDVIIETVSLKELNS